MVDKNLFLYDLAIVAIMKGEEPYVKEWLDYHLLAGADHFYIYDNDSTPEFKKILQPYIDAKIVTYTPYPGRARQYEAYNDAFKRFRFESRYMAWIDGDEFIFPKSKPTIAAVADEVIGDNPNFGGLVGNLRPFGSNGLEKADYSRGVLERFKKRAQGVNRHVSTIANPRKIDFFYNPHFAVYFAGCYAVNENRHIVQGPHNEECTANKLQMHHYHLKSREEFMEKIKRGTADGTQSRSMELFEIWDKETNDVFDEDILIFQDNRRAALIPQGEEINALFPRKQPNLPRLFNALAQNLVTTTVATMPPDFYEGKIENFLTCLSTTRYLREKLFDEEGAKIFEELSLNALFKSLQYSFVISDALLLISELPKILELNYPAVKKIREACINIIPQVMTSLRLSGQWQKFTDLEYALNLLKKIN